MNRPVQGVFCIILSIVAINKTHFRFLVIVVKYELCLKDSYVF